MGMFDRVFSSYDFGEQFRYNDLQTKCLEQLLYDYWISPKGELFLINTIKCSKLVFSDEYSFGFAQEPTGENGTITPVYHTGFIRLYPARWDGDYDSWPEIRVSFVNGKVSKWSHNG